MAIICPTITASNPHEYRSQMELAADFAQRVHIDLMDEVFAPTKSPDLDHIWWPHELIADIHLMYQNPMDYIDKLIHLKPHLVVIHNEAHIHHMDFAARLHKENIKVGLAVLHDTPIEYAFQIMHSFDHVLVFSGKLGYHGGEADLGLIDKVHKIRKHHPEAEIGWDGGINDLNAKQLVEVGVDVLNVGAYIQKTEDPFGAYAKLNSVTESE